MVSADGSQGLLYRNPLDCIIKTIRTEGVFALYKGFTAHYLRIGSVLSIVEDIFFISMEIILCI